MDHCDACYWYIIVIDIPNKCLPSFYVLAAYTQCTYTTKGAFSYAPIRVEWYKQFRLGKPRERQRVDTFEYRVKTLKR